MSKVGRSKLTANFLVGSALLSAFTFHHAFADDSLTDRIAEKMKIGLVGTASSSGSWPFTIFDVDLHKNGEFSAKIKWTTLDAIHSIDGRIEGDNIYFKEMSILKHGNAIIGCEYNITIDSNIPMKGTWGNCPGSNDGGVVSMSFQEQESPPADTAQNKLVVEENLASGPSPEPALTDSPSQLCTKLAGHPSETITGGTGVELEQIDAPKALSACKAAVSGIDATLMDHYHLARAYNSSGDKAKYMEELRIAARGGYAFAETKLGEAYYNGEDVGKDIYEAYYWLNRAAKQGERTALEDLSSIESQSANEAPASADDYDEAAEDVRQQEEERQREVERQNCQYNRAFGDLAAAWAGC
jgi:hypothetical protein